MDVPIEVITAAKLAVEDRLVELRDARIALLSVPNGLVIREKDGTDSPLVRLTTQIGAAIRELAESDPDAEQTIAELAERQAQPNGLEGVL